MPTLTTVCAWCIKEGDQVEVLGQVEVESEAYAGVTHGICSRHTEVMRSQIAALPRR
jgi:hypothetical protein